MFNEESGILEDDAKPGLYIYFETKDANFDKPLKLVDLARVMNGLTGVTVKYYASKMSSGPIQLAAHRNGIFIKGSLPSSVAYGEPR